MKQYLADYVDGATRTDEGVQAERAINLEKGEQALRSWLEAAENGSLREVYGLFEPTGTGPRLQRIARRDSEGGGWIFEI